MTTSDHDAAAAAAIRAHHRELQAGLRKRATAVQEAVGAGLDEAASRAQLLTYLRAEILPHAAAEERTLYRAAAEGRAALLVEAMIDEHHRLIAEVEALAAAPSAISTAWSSAGILALFEAHLWKENELLVPTVAADPDISLASLLAGMEELIGQASVPAEGH